MDELSERERSVELLQQLGLKEYEAKTFVALARLSSGTAKRISEVSDVPRTRVYDAVRVLESKGLVEVQHSNPQRFRAVSIDEAVLTLESEYRDRTERLRDALGGLERVDDDGDDTKHEVWSLSGNNAVTQRTAGMIDEASSEVVMVVGREPVWTEQLREPLQAAVERGVPVVVGTANEGLRARIQRDLTDAEVFVSGLEWLSNADREGVSINRLLLTDGSSILVSTAPVDPDGVEQAVFGRGFSNGVVTIVRRLMATRLLSGDDRGPESSVG